MPTRPQPEFFYPPGAVGTQPYIRRHGEFDGWYRKVDNRIADSPKQDISREAGKNGPLNDLGKGAS